MTPHPEKTEWITQTFHELTWQKKEKKLNRNGVLI